RQDLPGGSASAVTVDKQAQVVAAGHTSAGLTVAKFDRDGTLLWEQAVNGGANVFADANSVAVDNQGNVVVAGLTWNFGPDFFKHFTVAKFDRDGTLLWQQNLLGTANSIDRALSVALDNAANVVAVGFLENSDTFFNFTVAKFAR